MDLMENLMTDYYGVIDGYHLPVIIATCHNTFWVQNSLEKNQMNNRNGTYGLTQVVLRDIPNDFTQDIHHLFYSCDW